MSLDSLFLQTTHQTHTLRVALLISAVIHVAALLWVQIDYPDGGSPLAGPIIEVSLMTAAKVAEPASDEEPRPEIEPAPSAPEVTQTTQEHPSQPERELIQSTSQPNDVESSDPTDWQAIISTYAEESTVQNIEQERLRDAMWRKTFSVMFAPPDDWLIEDEPYLPDLQFEADKPKRLGIKISENCYLGFPGVDPQTVDSDMPGWSSGGAPQPTINLITCGFGK